MENLEGIFPIISEHLDSKFSGGVRFSKTAQSTTSKDFFAITKEKMQSELKSDSAKTPLPAWIFYENMGANLRIFLGLNCLERHPSLRERTRPQLLY